jgi:hypothetical protein
MRSRLIKRPLNQITRLPVLDLVSNGQGVLKVPNEFAARGSLVGHAPSFDFKMIRAPWRISKCSSGQMKSAFSNAALQIRKLLDRTTTSS